jgi:probable phosphoglycerate mutase
VKAILIRHCETDHNRDGLVQGRSDPPLNEVGQLQAARLAARFRDLPFDAIFSSPLRRAVETAGTMAVAQGKPVEVVPDLVELDVGQMDGLTGAEMRERYPSFMSSWLAGPQSTVRLPGGESLEEVQERAWSFLEALRGRGEFETVACVTHYFVLLSLICRALSLPLLRISRLRLGLGSCSVIEFRGERVQVMKLNDSCHLMPSA